MPRRAETVWVKPGTVRAALRRDARTAKRAFLLLTAVLPVATAAWAGGPTSDTWTATSSGNWSTDSNWSGSAAPGTSTNTITFNASGTTSYTATDDQASAFTLLVLNS